MIYKSIFSALLDIDPKSVPIFIPTFNQPSLLKLTLDQLNSYSDGPIIIYDNNSTFDPMVNLLNEVSKDLMVVTSNKNTGPRIFTEDLQILSLMPDYFIVTDPDLIYNKELPNDYIKEMKSILKQFNLAKVGFALEIENSNQIELFQDIEKVHKWEKQYWENVIGLTKTKDPVYSAFIDTTYSLNDKNASIYYRKLKKQTFRYPSARIGGKYTCQHLGWWKKDLIPQTKEEQEFYLKNQKWSHTEIFYYK